jgi:hypothetical protein
MTKAQVAFPFGQVSQEKAILFLVGRFRKIFFSETTWPN